MEVSNEAGEVGMTTAELLKKEGKIEGLLVLNSSYP